jgi:hypothetical protein
MAKGRFHQGCNSNATLITCAVTTDVERRRSGEHLFVRTPKLPPKNQTKSFFAFKKQKQRIPRRETETELCLAQLALFMEKEPQRTITTTPA